MTTQSFKHTDYRAFECALTILQFPHLGEPPLEFGIFASSKEELERVIKEKFPNAVAIKPDRFQTASIVAKRTDPNSMLS